MGVLWYLDTVPWYIILITFVLGLILLYLTIRVYPKKHIIGYEYLFKILVLFSIVTLTSGVSGLLTWYHGSGSVFVWYLCILAIFFFSNSIPVLWILYCLKVTGRTESITPRSTTILWGLMGAGFICRAINAFPSSPDSSFPEIITSIATGGQYLSALYLFILIFLGIVLLAGRYRSVSEKGRHLILFYTVGLTGPLLVLFIIDMISVHFYSIDIVVAITGLFIAVGILRSDIFSYSPIFREQFFSITNQGLVALDTRNRILDLNPAAEQFLKVSFQEAFGKTPADILSIPPEFREVFLHPELTTTSYHFPVGNHDPRWYQVSSWWSDTRIGADGAFLILIAEITESIILEQKMGETKLELMQEREKMSHERRYREFFRSHRDAILIIFEERIFECNPAALEMFQVSEGELTGSDPGLLSDPVQQDPDDIVEKLHYHIARAMNGTMEDFSWIYSVQGKKIPTEVRLSRLVHEDQIMVEMNIRDMSSFYDHKREEQVRYKDQEEFIAREMLLWDQVSRLVQEKQCIGEVQGQMIQSIIQRARINLEQLSDSPHILIQPGNSRK